MTRLKDFWKAWNSEETDFEELLLSTYDPSLDRLIKFTDLKTGRYIGCALELMWGDSCIEIDTYQPHVRFYNAETDRTTNSRKDYYFCGWNDALRTLVDEVESAMFE